MLKNIKVGAVALLVSVTVLAVVSEVAAGGRLRLASQAIKQQEEI